ncbi:MAG: GrpB family protein [Planctomycetota bacterium]
MRVVPYDPAWPKKYADEARRLWGAIGSMIEDVQHIGSTAIPGMAAKPMIDIAVAVADNAVVTSLIPPLAGIGYECRGLLAGIEGHHFFRKGDPRKYYLHVFERGSAFWAARIAFRDYLISHADEAAEYRALKERLAGEYADDRTSYTAEKKAFVERVTAIAVKAQESIPRTN